MHRSSFVALILALGISTPARAARPDRVWGTYLGGDQFDIVTAVTVDGAGNVYACGDTPSSGQATAGAHQEALAGGHDAILYKFTPAGARVWSTYSTAGRKRTPA